MGKPIRFRWLALLFPLLIAGAVAHAQQPSETEPAPSGIELVDPSLNKNPVETIVFIRHGEKHPNDEGQLTCQGLNRALALPAVLNAKFGKPDYLFAPLTSTRKVREGTFSYVRALATIEPTAIRAGLPVDTRFAFDEIGSLQGELCDKSYRQATVFVAWEHHKLLEIVHRLVSAFGGDEKAVPDWPADDFDSIFVLRLYNEPQGRKRITFTRDHEGLDGLSKDCPTAAGK